MSRPSPSPAGFVHQRLAYDEEIEPAILDTNLKDMFRCVRTGNLQRIKYLVEERDVPINVRDVWDSTPLYYACLCGHMPVVQYLLEHGARCEPDTFDGERCLYGALTDTIRDVLRAFKLKTLIKRDPFRDFMRKILQCTSFSDFSIRINTFHFRLHRCVLCARSPFLRTKLSEEWQSSHETRLHSKLIKPEAFSALVNYWYTGVLELPTQLVSAFLFLCSEFEEPILAQRVEFEAKNGAIAIELPIEKLQKDLQLLYRCALPREMPPVGNQGEPFVQADLLDMDSAEREDEPKTAPLCSYPDLCIALMGEDSTITHRFMAHRCFFFQRSEYFRALLDFNKLKQPEKSDEAPACDKPDDADSSNHAQTDMEMELINLRMRPEVFSEVVRFVYTQTAVLSQSIVWDVLEAAEMLFLVGLKRICASFIESTELDTGKCVELVNVARLFSLPRLENSAVRYISHNLDRLVCGCVGRRKQVKSKPVEQSQPGASDCGQEQHDRCQALCALIRTDASAVRERQETDTVIIVDEMRYHVNHSGLSPDTKRIRHQLIRALLDYVGISA